MPSQWTKHVSDDPAGLALLASQIGCLAALGWPGQPQWRVPPLLRLAGWSAALFGAALASVAGASLGPSLSPLPAPPPGAVLRTEGVYGFVRHPIYAGLLVAAGGVAIARGRAEPVIGAALLGGVLHLKAGHEEALLFQRFGSQYADYAAAVPRLLPYAVVMRAPGRRRSQPSPEQTP